MVSGMMSPQCLQQVLVPADTLNYPARMKAVPVCAQPDRDCPGMNIPALGSFVPGGLHKMCQTRLSCVCAPS